jgi:hypothetical protein
MSIKPLTPLGLAFSFAVQLAGWASAADGLQGASSHRSPVSAASQHRHQPGAVRVSKPADYRVSGMPAMSHKATNHAVEAVHHGSTPGGSAGKTAAGHAKAHGGKSKHHGNGHEHGRGGDEHGQHSQARGNGHGHKRGND